MCEVRIIYATKNFTSGEYFSLKMNQRLINFTTRNSSKKPGQPRISLQLKAM